MNLKLFVAAVSCSVSFSAFADITDSIAVYSTQNNQGSVSLGEKSFFTKDFKISIANISNKPIDLNKICLRAFSKDGKEFKLDTIDEKLAKGLLSPGKSVNGFAVFASDDASVSTAAVVKALSVCK
ncbi:DUF4354 family protein [Burkholderia oklahomensis]|uniref:DUF4354 family protein n=1 Tax=Burkholderia oklahomensis TaxID=342113 RepID=UPI00016A6E25|nr:DUF4354 family protein [Burkholderia oklahomensis]